MASLFSHGLSWGEKFSPFLCRANKCWLVIAKAFPCHLSSHLCYSQVEFPLSSPCLFPAQQTSRKELCLFVPRPHELPLFEAAVDKGLKSLGGGGGGEQHTKEHSTKIFDKMVELKSMLLSSDVYFFYWYVIKLSIRTVFSCLKIRHLWWAALITLYFPLSVLPLIKPVLVPDIFWRLLFRSPGLPSIADVVRPMLPSQKGI